MLRGAIGRRGDRQPWPSLPRWRAKPLDGARRGIRAADWVFRSGDGFEWSGYGLAAGDFDGDGQPDLAVGQPGSLYSAEGPGQVLLFLHPPRGTLTPADADVVLTSGDTGPDAFGFRLKSAALDGDARTDLIVSSPRESGEFPNDGAVHLIYGASL